MFFEKINADQLPAHSPYDCPIDLEEGHSPPFGPIYGLSESELQALRDYLTENLTKGFIQHSKSPVGAPTYSGFVPVMNGKQLSAHATAISNTRSCPSASPMHP